MRQGTGPDISDFQSRISAAEASIHEAIFTGDGAFDDDEPAYAPIRQEPDVSLEPYNPAMLPGVARAVPSGQDSVPNNRFDRYDALFKNSAPPPRVLQPDEASPAPQSGQSLRERLLARTPGSTLLKR